MKFLALMILLFILTMESSDRRHESHEKVDPKTAAPALGELIKPQAPKPKQRTFDILRDGFSFQNYTNKNSPLNLTAQTIERLCGNKACARGVGSSCVLTGAIRLFLEYANRSMSPGHCEGMSVLAQALFEGHVSLRDLDENADTTFALDFNNQKVQSEIAYWFATQLTYPGWTELNLKPSQIVERLLDPSERYSIGVRMPEKGMGHAITPARITEISQSVYRVQVYDSDYPKNLDQFLTIDTDQEAWSFAEFYGDEDTGTLTLSPLSKKIQRQECPTLSKDARWQVWLDGNGDLEVPEGSQSLSRDARTERGELDPMYLISSDGDVKIGIVADDDPEEQTTSVIMFRPNQAFALEGIALSRKERDELKLAKDKSSIVYTTKDDEEVRVRIAYTYEGADYEIVVSPDDDGGFTIWAKNIIDNTTQNHKLLLGISSNDDTPAKFGIEMTRIGDDLDAEFSHPRSSIVLQKNETATIEYGKWVKDKEPLSILRDFNSDGVMETNQFLEDKN